MVLAVWLCDPYFATKVAWILLQDPTYTKIHQNKFSGLGLGLKNLQTEFKTDIRLNRDFYEHIIILDIQYVINTVM